MDFKYLAIGICVALGVFLLINEASRKRKAHLPWRLAASTMVLVCFYFLLYPPVYNTKTAGGTQEFNLLTKGANLDHDLKGISYSLDEQVLKSPKKSALRFIADLEYFLKSNPALQVVHIYGNGLDHSQLELLKGKQLSFHPGSLEEGLTALNWNPQLKATEKLTLQGSYQNNGTEKLKFLLEGLGTNLDSVTIAGQGSQSFTLNARPQQAGKAVFRLIALKGRDTLFTEPIPIEIKTSAPVKVLMLASNPDFEYKFLKNWLFEKQYPLVFRTRISKDKYSTDFLNTDLKEINTLTGALLKKMDLLILDEEELMQLSGAELANVKRAVNEGLGLFIRIDQVKPDFHRGLGIEPGRYEVASEKHKGLNGILTKQQAKLSTLPIAQTLFLKSGNNDQILFQESSGKDLVSTSMYGMGRQTLSALSATYQWVLNGSDNDYADFWAEMLNRTGRASEVTQTWSMSPALPQTGESVNVSIDLANGGAVPKFRMENLVMSPLQNREIPTQWQLNSWATKPGWNTLSFGDAQDSFYVYGEADWQQLKDHQKRLATSQFVQDHPISAAVQKSSVLLEEKLSLWWFLLPLLISVSFLWYETKML
ncbi:hypothetical protein [Pedobacter gandavensis]|uniref:hypothetical protein n=1 Tax=Pedobacter gandavensis TaxID=2679963 RepID=UPI002931EFBD|nr:hypothetical protein [Pedobacter gandavensis]